MEVLLNYKTDKLEILSVDGNTCDIIYHGIRYDGCEIEEMKNGYVFIGLPEHWMCGELIAKNEEGPIINIH
jgi:hypothetical protein